MEHCRGSQHSSRMQCATGSCCKSMVEATTMSCHGATWGVTRFLQLSCVFHWLYYGSWPSYLHSQGSFFNQLQTGDGLLVISTMAWASLPRRIPNYWSSIEVRLFNHQSVNSQKGPKSCFKYHWFFEWESPMLSAKGAEIWDSARWQATTICCQCHE